VKGWLKVLQTHFGNAEVLSEVMETPARAHHGIVEAHLGVVEAPKGATEAHPWSWRLV
jgi:hypothetical protein